MIRDVVAYRGRGAQMRNPGPLGGLALGSLWSGAQSRCRAKLHRRAGLEYTALRSNNCCENHHPHQC
jgi:hypothetical protein